MANDSGGDGKVEPAPYAASGNPENESVDILNYIFPERVKSNIDTWDKIPNHDSWVEVVDNSGVPLGTLIVQVKKLPDEHQDDPKKQFDTRHLSYCRTRLDPFIAIVVDIEDEVGYWKHISVDWFEDQGLDDQKTKLVDFSEENAISTEDTSYIEDWVDVIEETKNRIENYDEYQDLKARFNPAIGKTREEFAYIHDFLDEYQSLLETDFQAVKEGLFPNVWKFGFGNIEFEEDQLRYTLYPINEKENDAQIRDIDASWDEVHDLGGEMMTGHFMTNPLLRDPKDYSYNAIKTRAKELIEENKLDYSDAPFLLENYLYKFTRKYARVLGLDKKEEYSIEEVRKGYFQYLQFFLLDNHRDVLTSTTQGEVHIGVEGIVNGEPDVFEEQSHEFAQERMQETDSNPPRLNLQFNEFDRGAVERFIEQLVESEMERVSNPYRERDRTPEDPSSILDFYSDEALIENIETYFEDYHRGIRSLVDQNFPNLADEITPAETNHLLLIANLRNLRDIGGLSIKKFWLDSSEDSLRVDVRTQEGFSFEERIFSIDTIDFEGEEYIVKSPGAEGNRSLIDIDHEDFPVFKDVHEELKRNLEDYIEDKSISTHAQT